MKHALFAVLALGGWAVGGASARADWAWGPPGACGCESCGAACCPADDGCGHKFLGRLKDRLHCCKTSCCTPCEPACCEVTCGCECAPSCRHGLCDKLHGLCDRFKGGSCGGCDTCGGCKHHCFGFLHKHGGDCGCCP